MGCGQSKKQEILQIQEIKRPPEPKRTLKATQAAPTPTPRKQRKIKTYYEIGEVLGQGAFAIVHKGVNKKSGAEVAIKCIDRNDLPEEDEASLRQEVDILKSLDHPNIVKFLDFFEEDKFFYVVLEFLPGGELFERIVQKNFYTEKEARDVVRTVCSGVKYCHDKGIAHRDLKPQNLLLTSMGDDAIVKIADFGFARKSAPSTKLLETQCGTPEFMAPEILNGHLYNKAVDMWAIGVITYLLLGGYPPFQHTNTNKLFQQIRKGKFEFHEKYWSTVSDEAKNLIEGLLRVDTETRLTVDQVLSHPWITRDDAELLERNLSANLNILKRYENNRLRGAVKKVIAINNFTKLHKPPSPMTQDTMNLMATEMTPNQTLIEETAEDLQLHDSN